MAINGVMLQTFNWNYPSDGQFYNQLNVNCTYLSNMGVTSLWLPPSSKGIGGKYDVGYGIYDMWDLGEFNQKGTVGTKYGKKAELESCVAKCKSLGIQIYADIVMNHRLGGDTTEKFTARTVDTNNRLSDTSQDFDMEGWTKFLFSNRTKKYSDFMLQSYHFVGLDFRQSVKYNKKRDKVEIDSQTIYRIVGKDKYWSKYVSTEYGNYDYLLGNDLDLNHPEVYNEIMKHTSWLINLLKLDGLRIDAAKHIDYQVLNRMLSALKSTTNKNLFVVGEYWKDSFFELEAYLKSMQFNVNLFDVPLHYNLFKISNFNLELSKVFDNTLVSKYPANAVTFVDNHDTEPGQSLQSYISLWFRPHAYCLILLRESGYPTLFFNDLYQSKDLQSKLEPLVKLRKQFNVGKQVDYFDYPTCVGWLRLNTVNTKPALVVVLNSGDKLGWKAMSLGVDRKNQTCTPQFASKQLQNNSVKLDAKGEATFFVEPKDIAVFTCI